MFDRRSSIIFESSAVEQLESKRSSTRATLSKKPGLSGLFFVSYSVLGHAKGFFLPV
jgi:hypothetical protein